VRGQAPKKAVEAHLSALLELPPDELLQQRHTKSRRMGVLGGG
jgi:acetyl-CoA carboxylase alpha subunit